MSEWICTLFLWYRGENYFILNQSLRNFEVVQIQKSGQVFITPLNPFTNMQHGLTRVSVSITNHMHNKMWDEITHSFPNLNCSTVDVWECISNLIDVIILMGLELTHWSLGDVVVILKVQSRNTCYGLSLWASLVRLLWSECHRTRLMRSTLVQVIQFFVLLLCDIISSTIKSTNRIRFSWRSATTEKDKIDKLLK